MMKNFISLLSILSFFLYSTSSLGQIYLITNTNPSGVGSLNAALTFVNDHDGPDTIHFDIPGNGPFYLNTSLPFWDDETLIDATSQPDFYLGKIVIGVDADDWENLYVFGDHCDFYGLAADSIALFGGNDFQIGAPGKSNWLHAIYAENSDNGIIQSNLIGTNADGTMGLGTPGSGIITTSSDHMLIGGDLPEEGNLISGKLKDGMELQDPKSFIIKNNKVGTDITGTFAIPNGRHGIYGVVHDPITIGEGLSNGNLISGNIGHGVLTVSITNGNCMIIGNKIGTDITGELPIPNGKKGMWISGGTPVTITQNTIAYHPEEGIYTEDVVNKKRITDNSMFCNEMGGYYIDRTETLSIDFISMSTVMGSGPAGSIIDLYRTDPESCMDSPCQGKYFMESTIADITGHWVFSGTFEAGLYMVNTTSTELITAMISPCHLIEIPVSAPTLQHASYQLTQNEPNPFNGSTQFSVYLPSAEKGVLNLYDLTGRLILKKEQAFLAGWNTITLHADDFPKAGMYIYSFRTAHFLQSKKMIKIK